MQDPNEVQLLNRARLETGQRAEESVEAWQHKDIAKVILATMADHGGELSVKNMSRLAEWLEAPEDAVKATIGYLISECITTPIEYGQWDTDKQWPQIQFMPGIRDGYVRTNMLSTAPLLVRDGLSTKTTQRALGAIYPDAEWQFVKEYMFDLETLHAIRDTTHQQVQAVLAQEATRCQTQLGIPLGYTEGRPSFGAAVDPTKNAGQTVTKFTLTGSFPTVTAAFEAGFDKALGSPKAKRNYRTTSSEVTTNQFPCHIQVERTGEAYKLGLYNGSWAAALNGSIPYFQDTREKATKLKATLESALQD